MKEPALKIENLKKKYKTGTEALKGVSLEVPAGERCGQNYAYRYCYGSCEQD